jgi:alanyl-tRNA synthetase
MSMTSAEIRQSFLDFFASKEHTIVPSASLVPGDDPTLLFTNAGMNQFKNIFLGLEKREYTRAADTQKCLRVSGKHNDLEDVGYDTYHHTFFEMLGNWSFGDYYKREAIAWAWELLTEVWGLPRERLWATVFKDEEGELETDEEAACYWTEVTDIDPDHVVYFGRKDNFWEMGDTGPCGPCSEIHLDRGEEACDLQDDPNHVCGVNSGCRRYFELWNLVFIQYDKDESGTLHELPAKHVDTGMGFERLVSVLQGVISNYETDVFTPIMDRVQEMLGHSDAEREANIVAYRVIADHGRAVTFLVGDGVLPGNEGRNYVLRMILRRAARFGRKIGFREPFLAEIAKVVIETMGPHFTELEARREFILQTITREEERFQQTLDVGLSLLDNLIETQRALAEALSRPVNAVQQALAEAISRPLDAQKRAVAEFMSQRLEAQQRALAEALSSPLEAQQRALAEFMSQRLEARQRALTESISRSLEAPQQSIAEAMSRLLEAQQRALAEAISRPVEALQQSIAEFMSQRLEAQRRVLAEAVSWPLEAQQRLVEQIQEEVVRTFKTIPGIEAFRLYDTYGFPLDLTRDVAKERGFTVDDEGFEAALEKQRERGRAAQQFALEVEAKLELYSHLLDDLKRTGALSQAGVEHLCSEGTEAEAKVAAIVRDGQVVNSAREGDEVELVLTATPFYVESGGQVSDTGVIIRDGQWEVAINDVCQPLAGLIVHIGEVLSGGPRVGDSVQAVVDAERRMDIARNHTATHLLHNALRRVLGEHVQQAGSLVAPDHLRFDFTHLAMLTPDERSRIEKLVNDAILANYPVTAVHSSYKEAIAAGAIALFGEKYGEQVRVLKTGDPSKPFSQELCGGTHVQRTSEIGSFDIVSESSIGAGLRRIEAVTGRGAREFVQKRMRVLEAAAASLACSPDEVDQKVLSLQSELQGQGREVARLRREIAQRDFEDLLSRVQDVNGVKVLSAQVEAADIATLREMSDWFRNRMGSGVIVLGAVMAEKPGFVAAITPDLVERGLHAGRLVKQVAQVVGGGGGGKPTLAQAGGRETSRIGEALSLVIDLVGRWPELVEGEGLS